MLIWSRKGEGTGKLHLPSHPEIPSGHPRLPRPSSLCPRASSRGQAAGAKASVGMTSFLTGQQHRGGTVPWQDEPTTPATRRDAARDHQHWPSRSPAKRCPAVPTSPVHRRVPRRPGNGSDPQGGSPGDGAHRRSPCLVWVRGSLSAQPHPWRLGTPLPTHLL